MPTTVLRRPNSSPRWGDEILHRGLANWAKGMPPIEAKFILQRLLQISFVIPADNPPPGEEGVVLKTVETEDGGCILPAFTHPSLLSEYARAMHWIVDDDDILPSHCMEAKELFAHMAQTEGIQLAVNAGKSALRLTSADCEKLSKGELPDLSRLIGAPPGMTTSAMMRAMGFETATEKIPERILGTVRLFLQNEPAVQYASLFSIGDLATAVELTLGIKFSVARSPVIDKFIDKIQMTLVRALAGNPKVKVVYLEDPLEPVVRMKVTPFYKR
jgi:hypothetical protein